MGGKKKKKKKNLMLRSAFYFLPSIFKNELKFSEHETLHGDSPPLRTALNRSKHFAAK